MKTAPIHNLHQHWIAAGKQPVVFFSSQDHKIHPNNLPTAPIFGLSVLPEQSVAQQTAATFIPVEVAQTQAVPVVAPQISDQQPRQRTLPRIRVPEIHLPQLPTIRLPQLPRLIWPKQPHISLPAFSAPRISLPTIIWPHITLPRIKRPQIALPSINWTPWLRWGTRLAYGGAVAAFVLFLTPIIVLEGQTLAMRVERNISQRFPSAQNEPQASPEPSPTAEPEINTAHDYFSVDFPRLNISSRIIPNVDPGSATDYEASLKLGVAHAKGTGLPDDTSENKTIYLFAHSTNAAFNIQRYNAQFYALKDSIAGDSINVRYWGQDYEYIVEEIKIVDANDTTYLQPQTDRELLILQTCYPPGTTWKRLVVIASKKPATQVASQ